MFLLHSECSARLCRVFLSCPFQKRVVVFGLNVLVLQCLCAYIQIQLARLYISTCHKRQKVSLLHHVETSYQTNMPCHRDGEEGICKMFVLSSGTYNVLREAAKPVKSTVLYRGVLGLSVP
jgi:hypothetical protein